MEAQWTPLLAGLLLAIGMSVTLATPADANNRQFRNTVGGAAVGAGVGHLVGGKSGARAGAVVGAIAGATK